MCWSEGASLAMVGIGTVATVVALRRGEPRAIPAALGYFTFMEALQAAGYQVLNECGAVGNQTVTLLSYLHIALQPIFINAFAMAITPIGVSQAMRRRVYLLSALASAFLLLRLVPLDFWGPCKEGQVLCARQFCTVAGNWHLGWQVPLNDLWGALIGPVSKVIQFPDYLLAVFVLPLFYGAWRFVVFHAAVGPLLAMILTDNPFEMPAIWCLFSIGIVLGGTSSIFRQKVFQGRTV
ncbi:DUF5765 domain-containing protein [Actibacterium pelagium]|uniref:Uncharacterized protein n=1 Tax=Actibacterium pelagium TaxID=2029103 RepID=A0A917EJK3_9RHOB|nr:DUF5765 domain-containing protein [Actibacterium pelagium]GGE45246.1 hypothetical protein GCM10011517_11080 [Actibacterium pelagium]